MRTIRMPRERLVYVLGQIHTAAVETPDQLALAYNGEPYSYARFWRMLAARRAELEPRLRGKSGVVLLAIDSLLDGWIAGYAARSLGLHTAALRVDADGSLFDAADVAAVLAVEGEGRGEGVGHTAPIVLAPAAGLLSTQETGPLPEPPAWPESGGHILLTSGTTGLPKKVLTRCGSTEGDSAALGNGVVLMWRGTVRCVFNLGGWTGAGYWTPTWTWCGQGAVVIWQGVDIENALAYPGVNHAVCTPGYIADLLSRPEGAYPFRPDLTLTITAEALSPGMLSEIRRRICPRIAINLSSTEVGGWARGLVASDEDLFWYHVDPNRQVEVVDDDGRPLPPRQLGRVRVRVASGAEHGYFRDPELTTQMFEGEWFYPGDLGELDGEGRIALHGRHTDVVSIKGGKHPVAPWERALQERLGCEGLCILSGRWGERAEQLHLFLESSRPIGADELREAAQSVLWGFENVAVHKLERLPRTPLGKVHRYELTRRLHAGEFGGV